MSQLKRFAAIGECMIEMSHLDANTCHLAYAGDTYNVAIYCARASDSKQLSVEYVTALGMDPYSDAMLEAWHEEGIESSLVRRLDDRMPGLYLIRTDEQGERRFFYYRSQAAARDVFKGSEGARVLAQLSEFDGLYFSGISIAILDEESRQQFFMALEVIRKQGTLICFDSNYRPSLWKSADEAREVTTQFLSVVDIALPSFDDEHDLFGDNDYKTIAKRAHDAGVKEVVVKRGGQGYFLSGPDATKWVAITPSEKIIDTTAAGDSFNGTYLAARLQDVNPEEAATRACEVSMKVIAYPGAIIPKDRYFREESSTVGLLDDIPKNMPALMRSNEIQDRVEDVGFDWEHVEQIIEKLKEEVAEFEIEVEADNREAMLDELGDILFTTVNIARRVGVDPEQALRFSNDKFTRRFHFLEQASTELKRPLDKMSFEEKLVLWKEAKLKNDQKKS